MEEKENVVTEYLVRTQGQWDWLMEYLEDTTDLKWARQEKPTSNDTWSVYGEDTRVFAGTGLMYGNSSYWEDTKAIEVVDLMDEVETEFRERKQHTITSELEEAITHSEMVELLDLEDTFVYVYCYGEEEGVLEVYEFKADGFGLFEAFDAYYIEDEGGLLGTFSVGQVARIWKQEGKVEEDE